jgi:hypothetical protein
MIGQTLKYFMWAWQHQFQGGAALTTKRLLDRLDPLLESDTFLVGFLLDENDNTRHPTCVSPDDCVFQPAIFAGISNLVEQLAADDPGATIRYGAPTDPDLGQRMAIQRAFPLALEQILSKRDKKSAFFSSSPTFVEGYIVLVVVQVNRTRLESHYRLTRDFIQKGAFRYTVGRSLIETTIRAYLEALAEKLKQPNPGEDVILIKDDSSVYRAAASKLMYGPAWAGGDLLPIGDIYELCNTLSLQKYEGEEGEGQIVFARRDHPSAKLSLRLRSPVRVYDYGAVRKLLQMGSGKLSLFCNSRCIYGLGTVEQYDPTGEDLFVVKFLKRFTWEMSHADHVLMHCREGKPQLCAPGPRPAAIREALTRIFKDDRIDHLAILAETVATQKHGAMLVITPSAAEEANRLAKQGTVIEPVPLTPELIPLVTVIDAAVLIDLEGTCHAIGVILDGMANDKCTSARGARYKSGVRYAYEKGKMDRMVLVKSEDGMVNVLPEPETKPKLTGTR